MEIPSLVAGLGNPGSKYARTRHNVGFMAVETLSRRWYASLESENRFQCRMAKVDRKAGRVFLCQPQTYMNASGEAVGSLAVFYRLPPERVLVVVDDADLPVGTIRLRGEGSSGGHHGLESIEQHLGTKGFPRLRIGIGRRTEGVREITGHVLSPFAEDEWKLMEAVVARACDQVESWLDEGIAHAMNRFNGAVKIGSEER